MLQNSLQPLTRQASATAFHLKAIRLPAGDQPEDWWICDGELLDHPVEGAVELPGNFMLPGLVDAHAHLTLDFNNTQLRGADLIRHNIKVQMQAGVLVIRDMGTAPGTNLSPDEYDDIHVVKPSPLFAPPQRYFNGLAKEVTEAELLPAALESIANGASWVKVIADFAGGDGNWWNCPANYSTKTLEKVIQAVHEKGRRIAMHTTGRFASELVRLGVDSIEHGPSLQEADIAEMARRGVAWCPTLAVSAHYAGMASQAGGSTGEAARESLKQMKQLIPLAEQLGVTMLVGTDELPHGSIAAEAVVLNQYGLPTLGTLAAASTRACDFLNVPTYQTGMPANIVLFDDDPREDLHVLAHPTAVIANGKRVK